MRGRAIVVGLSAGVLVGGLIVAISRQWPAGGQRPPGRADGPPSLPAPAARPLAEDHGRIVRVVMHYHPQAADAVVLVYAQFLRAIGPDVEVAWLAASQPDADDLKARLGPDWPAGRCRVVLAGKEISTWSRDRCIVLAESAGGRAVLLAPARSLAASPARTNDQETPYLLAAGLGDRFACRGLDIDFDGGDLLITRRHVFAHPALVEKNGSRPGGPGATGPDAIGRYLGEQLGRAVTWLGTRPEDAPAHHVGMYLTVIEGTAFVGDVRLAESIAATQPDVAAALQPGGGPAPAGARAALADQLDRTATAMASTGYAVVRVPLLPSATPRAWLSYNNGIVQTFDGRATYYMPTFAAPALDETAAAIFRAAGPTACRVVPIDCSAVWPLGGSLHCLVNVVARR